MGLLDKFKKEQSSKTKKAKGTGKKRKGRRAFVLSIDGTPYTFLQKIFKQGLMPNLAELADKGCMRQMDSVLPTVSSVAWASFQSGKNPGKHGIYGFVERVPKSYNIRIPNGSNLKGKVLWEVLSEQDRRVFAMNVPESFPPRKVKGMVIGGFLCPSLEKVAYPSSVNQTLKEMDYVIDAEPWVAHEDLDKFMRLLFKALDRRAAAALHFYKKKAYDFFMVHVMETDRINHFYWRMYTSGHEKYKPQFIEFYQKIDELVGKIRKILRDDTELVVMSDHGFCDLEKEVNMNRWLNEQGFLEFAKEKKEMTIDMDPSKTQVYSLIPGRFFVNTHGREPGGIVKKGEEKEKVLDSLVHALRIYKSEDGRNVIDRALRRGEVYHGPLLKKAPDVIAHPEDGFDLKAGGRKVPLYKQGPLVGMHTFPDATFITSEASLPDKRFSIIDATATILKIMEAEIPEDMDGIPQV